MEFFCLGLENQLHDKEQETPLAATFTCHPEPFNSTITPPSSLSIKPTPSSSAFDLTASTEGS